MISTVNIHGELDIKPVVVFSIATVPDVTGIRHLHALPAALADNEVVEFAYQKGRALADASNAPDMLPLHLHRIASIACSIYDGQQFRAFSLAQADNDEAALIQRFCDLIDQENAQVVSWKGDCFDVPVLQSRGLVHGASAAAFRRLTDVASIGLSHNFALPSVDGISLHELAGLCGLPCTNRLPGKQVWHAWHTGRAEDVHACCETDSVICHMVYLRFQLLHGILDATRYARELRRIHEMLTMRDAQPWREFLADWAF